MANFTVDLYESDNTTFVKTLNNSMFWDGTVYYALRGDNDKFVFSVDPNDPDVPQLTINRIVHLNHTDQNFSRRYRIFKVNRRRDGDKRFYEIEARALKFDLLDQIHFSNETIIQQTPLTHINKILSGSGWSAGVVQPATLITIQYKYNNRLFDLEQVRDAVRETGDYELVFNDNKTVDLKIVKTTSTSTIEFRKNLLSINREQVPPLATRVYGLGGISDDGKQMTIAGGGFRVLAVQLSTGTDKGQVTLNSSKVFISNNDHIGRYAYRRGDSFAYAIQSWFLDPNDNTVLTLTPDPTTVSVDDIIEIQDSQGNPVDYLRNKDSEDNYGIIEDVYIDETYEDVENLAGPERISTLSGTYTNGLAEGWQKVGGVSVTVSENTNSAFVIHGSKSQHVVVNSVTATPIAPTLSLLGLGPLSGTYQYKIAWVTKDGIAPASPASSIVASNNMIKLDLQQPPSDSHYVGTAVFRTKAGGTTFYFLAFLPRLYSASFIDFIQDGALSVDETSYIDGNKAAGGQGVAIDIPVKKNVTYSIVVYTIVLSGSIRIEIEYPANQTFPEETLASRGSTPVSSQTKVTIIAQGITPEADGTMTIKILANSSTADYYVDSIMVVDNPYAPNPERFYPDIAKKELW